MIIKNYDKSIEMNHSSNWPYFPNHAYSISPIGGLGSGKTNMLLNLMKYQGQDIICKLKIHLNVSINCLFIEEKK